MTGPQQPTRYEYSYITIADGFPTMFVIGAIADDVARGIRDGLVGVPTITDVTAYQVIEHRENVPLPPGPGGPVQFASASAIITSNNWLHTIPEEGTPGLLILAAFNSDPGDPAVIDYTMSCGGTPLESLGKSNEPTNGFWIEAFSLVGVPVGDQTLAWDFPDQPNMVARCQSLVYHNVAGFGGFVSRNGSDKAANVTVSSATNHMAAAMLAFDGMPVTDYTLPTQTERGSFIAGPMPGVETQDSPGATSVTFGITLVSKTGWCGCGVDIIQA